MPESGTPRFTIQLNAESASDYGLPDGKLNIALDFENTPVGYVFYLREFRNSDWLGIGTTNPVYGVAIPGFIQELNAVGLIAWIKANICPWVNSTLKAFYAGKVGGVLPTPVEPITTANIVGQMNAALGGFVLQDRDGDGLPELYQK